MAGHNFTEETISESIEMYLLRVATLQQSGQPVPVPQLAQELSISPVSAHEMCRKLTERGLVQYEPYKGVTLTGAGEALAQRVLRSRTLWKKFFVEKLNIPLLEADEFACRFEHVTPDELAERLATFLQNSPDETKSPLPVPLTALLTSAQVQIVSLDVDNTAKEYLAHQGVQVGSVLEILAAAEDSALLVNVLGQQMLGQQMLGQQMLGQQLTLSWRFAQNIKAIPLPSEPK